jgi:hypothetical protein
MPSRPRELQDYINPGNRLSQICLERQDEVTTFAWISWPLRPGPMEVQGLAGDDRLKPVQDLPLLDYVIGCG